MCFPSRARLYHNNSFIALLPFISRCCYQRGHLLKWRTWLYDILRNGLTFLARYPAWPVLEFTKCQDRQNWASFLVSVFSVIVNFKNWVYNYSWRIFTHDTGHWLFHLVKSRVTTIFSSNSSFIPFAFRQQNHEEHFYNDNHLDTHSIVQGCFYGYFKFAIWLDWEFNRYHDSSSFPYSTRCWEYQGSVPPLKPYPHKHGTSPVYVCNMLQRSY